MNKIYDQMRAEKGKPSDPLKGAYPSRLLSDWWLYTYKPGTTQYDVEAGVNEAKFESEFRWIYNQDPTALFTLNMEYYNFHPELKQREILRACRDLRKAAKLLGQYTDVGFYATLPARSTDAWKSPVTLQEWTDTTKLQVELLGDYVDYVAPSLYTMTLDPAEWLAFADANYKQAQLFNKPIKFYLWARFYRPSAALGTNSGKLIPYDFFMTQMKWCLERGDIILWDDAQSPWAGTDSQKAIVDLLKEREKMPVPKS